jgi:hypothetical protein
MVGPRRFIVGFKLDDNKGILPTISIVRCRKHARLQRAERDEHNEYHQGRQLPAHTASSTLNSYRPLKRHRGLIKRHVHARIRVLQFILEDWCRTLHSKIDKSSVRMRSR